MTLKEIFDAFNELALKQPSISEIIKSGNIYDLNGMRNAKYAVFCAVQDTHSLDVENSVMNYRFFLYYVDRLSSDKDNKIDVQSTAINTLTNIIRVFADKYDAEVLSVDFNPFTDSFDGLGAGAYATINLSVFIDGCKEDFE